MKLSSRQAAVLLHTHESSVKRWCNAGALPCSFTNGGHRRIQLDDLLLFADSQEVDCELLRLGGDAEMALKSVFRLRRGVLSNDVVTLLKDWLLESQSRKVLALIIVARSFGISLSVIFDKMIGDLMRHIGESWAAGSFGIGEEHRVSECILDVLYHLQSEVEASDDRMRPTAILGTGPDDDHVTGALMVRTLLTEIGWNVVFLGRKVPVEDFVLFQQKYKASLVCISLAADRSLADVSSFITSVRSLSGNDGFQIAFGGSGARSLLRAPTTAPDHSGVFFFESATEFGSWADTTLNHLLTPYHEVN